MRSYLHGFVKTCGGPSLCGAIRLHTSPPLCVAPAGPDTQENTVSSSSSLAYVSFENPSHSQRQTPLVIQHGLFGRKENFTHLGKKFHHLTRRGVVLPDMRNHGASPPCRSLSLRQMSADLVRLTSQLGIDKACLLGHATGGRVAMLTALNRPELVDRLIVVSSSPLNTQDSMDRWLRNREACLVLEEFIRNSDSNTSTGVQDNCRNAVELKLEANEVLKPILTDSNERALFISNLGTVNVSPLLNSSAELGSFPDMQGHTFTGPTLFITGVKSSVWETDREVRDIKQLFPNSNFVKIPGSSHWPHTEASDDFLAIAVAFLQTEF